MRNRVGVEIDIGINETRENFTRRLMTKYNGYFSMQDLKHEALFQSTWRDIEMSTTVSQLKLPMLEMLQQVLGK